MDLTQPLRVVTPTLDGDVLSVLCGTRAPLTGREVHRILGRASEGGVRRALDRLWGQGIVSRESAGRAHLYALNRRHMAARYVCALASLRAELIEALRSAVGAWTVAPVVAVLFGSSARGDGDERSDVDLLLVRPSGIDADDDIWRGQAELLAESVFAWTGNSAEIVEWGEDELSRALLGEAVLANAAREGVVLAGAAEALRPAVATSSGRLK